MKSLMTMTVVTQLALAAGGALWAVSAGPALAANDPGITDHHILVCAYQPMTGTEFKLLPSGQGRRRVVQIRQRPWRDRRIPR